MSDRGRSSQLAAQLRLNAALVSFLFASIVATTARADVAVDLIAYRETSGVTVTRDGTRLNCTWPIEKGETASMTFQLAPERPLIQEMAIGGAPVLVDVDPVLVMTVGSRNLSDKAGWIAFFDNPPKRPHEKYLAELKKTSARVESSGARTTVIVGDLTCGPFRGDMRFTFFRGSPLVQATAVLSTEKNGCAILYDAGLVAGGETPSWETISFIDGKAKSDLGPRKSPRVDGANVETARYRTIIAEARSGGGAIAIFPPPHQYLYPLDFADNFGFVWHGGNWRDLVKRTGFGVRQTIEGDNRYVPWVNAPPKTQQKLSVFYLLTRGEAIDATQQVKRYTHGDTFKPLDGHKVFTSHYHVEHTLDFVRQQRRQGTNGIPRSLREPGFVKTFRAHGVDIVHLAEFHVHHTPEMNAKRLDLLRAMHDECERLSEDGKFVLLPGEEPNVHLGGHWISFFPRRVYWTLQRGKEEPFVEEVDGLGNVYHVGSSSDVLKLMEAEKGLMWTAHPRIKGSFGFPDAYRGTDFYQSDRFLGAAWKAMPADYSHDNLGQRVLDLLDDMNNWGKPKFAVGEVDVFKVEPDYELYGHMNVNYLKLNRLPRFSEGWPSVLDALRAGDFFVTTGEVLIPSWSFDRARGEVVADVEWTFPLAFAQVVSGDGQKIYRNHLDLTDTQSFSSRTLRIPFDASGRKWVRLEVWDVAANGAFTQPLRIDSK